MEDHAIDNKAGAVQMNVQTVLIVIGAAFILGFALSALIMFRGGNARHECDADLSDEHQIPAPVELRTASITKKKSSSEG